MALRAGNLLVGNAENAAAIEMTLSGGTFEFESDAVIALTGADFAAGVWPWAAHAVKAGTVLQCGAARHGARGYLCVRGGIATPRVLGSASAHLTSGLGGRALKSGDLLPVGDRAVRRPRNRPADNRLFEIPARLRVTAGPQADWFSDDLYRGDYTVSESSDRMGIRLQGATLLSPEGNMLTEGVSLGAVQVPPGGQPIILFVEHQTTGGYPKPANVISADFWRVGQLRPRDEVAFELVSMDCALALLQEQEAWIYSLL
jgi:antagonist of KipI